MIVYRIFANSFNVLYGLYNPQSLEPELLLKFLYSEQLLRFFDPWLASILPKI